MYENFVKICEANVLECSVLDALYMYSKINYLELASPQLVKHMKKHEKVSVVDPLPESVVKRLPEFKGERIPLSSFTDVPRMNTHSYVQTPEVKKKLEFGATAGIRMRRFTHKKYRGYTK